MSLFVRAREIVSYLERTLVFSCGDLDLLISIFIDVSCTGVRNCPAIMFSYSGENNFT